MPLLNPVEGGVTPRLSTLTALQESGATLAPMLGQWHAPGIPLAAVGWLDARRLVNFILIGLACTTIFAIVYGLLRQSIPPIEANVLALSTTITLNFAANRWLTFAAQDGSLRRQAVTYFIAYLFGLASSSLVLWVSIQALHPHGAGELLLAVIASSFATVVRFVLMASWVFARPASRANSTRGDFDG